MATRHGPTRRRSHRQALAAGAVGLAFALALGHGFVATAAAADPVPPETLLGTIAPNVPTWFTFEVTGVARDAAVDHVECQLDAAAWVPCATPWAPTLVAGAHVIQARAVDVNGLADPTPATASFTVVDEGPAVTVSINHGADATGRTLVRLDVEGTAVDGATRIHIGNSDAVDDQGWLAPAWVGYLDTLRNADHAWDLALPSAGGTANPGLHRVCVQTEDVYGNKGPVACDAITFDPAIATAVRVRVAASENPAPLGDRVILRAVAEAADGAPIRDGTLAVWVHTPTGIIEDTTATGYADPGAWVDASALAAGTYDVGASFNGSTELEDVVVGTTLRIATTEGLTPPFAHFEGSLPSWDDPKPFTLAIRAGNNAVSRYQCRVDAAPWTSCAGTLSIGVLADGTHTAEVRGISANGTVQPDPDLVAWRVNTSIVGQWSVLSASGPTRLATVMLDFNVGTAQAVRISSVRTVDAEGRLAPSMELRPVPTQGHLQEWSLIDPAYGGVDRDGTKRIWIQVQAADGTWSAPDLSTVLLDRTKPELVMRIEAGSPFVDAGSLFVLGKTGEPARVFVTDDPAVAANPNGLGTGTEGGLAFIAWPVDVAPGEVVTTTLYARAMDTAGNWSDVEAASVVIDRSTPTAELRPVAFVLGSQVSARSVDAWVRTASADTGSGVAKTTLQSLTSSRTTTLASVASASVKVRHPLEFGVGRRFRARARDVVGHTGAWVTGPWTRPVLRDSRSSLVRWTAGWTSMAATSALGGSYRRASAAGATASLRFTGRAVAVVAPTGSRLGKVDVLVDGVVAQTVDLRSATGRARVVVFARAWSAAGDHAIAVRCRATPGRPSVTLDAFVVLP